MTGTSAPRAVDLAPLLAALEGARALGALDRVALGIEHDSRAVRSGSVFVALRGERADGHAFLGDALRRGAGTLVVDERYAAAHGVPAGAATIVVPDTRRALSRLAAAYYGDPSASLAVAGITGTNGKTTTALLAAAMLGEGGLAAGMLGTLGGRFGDARWPLENTTPPASELQALLARMRDLGARAVVMEVSSHGLALDRVADVRFAAGALTNVTRDHLDFHGTFEAYAAAKRSLFERAADVVLNVDDSYGKRWAAELAAAGRRPLTYGFSEDAAVRATRLEAAAGGMTFEVGGLRFTSPLAGRFNVYNALAALCVARVMGAGDGAAARALAAFEGVPGRMERLADAGVAVFVDYAHTPDALGAALRAAREATDGALTVVFGCGGDRDRGKRPEMGRIASELADRVIVTSDNPRHEAAVAIAREVAGGIADPSRARIELDRRAAIRRAVLEAAPGDVVVVAGKGHETYQLAAGTAHHFDDRDEVRAALAARRTAGES